LLYLFHFHFFTTNKVFRVGRDNICTILVTLVPVIGAVGEQKTKPTQSALKELRSLVKENKHKQTNKHE